MNTVFVLLEGMGRNIALWGTALLRWRDPRAPMRGRRAAMLLLAMPLFLLVQIAHALCLMLDEVVFPGYRRVGVGRALFVTGIPRSGTTFIHRTLSRDADRFTTFRTWQALFAPSIVQRRLVQGLAAVDRVFGSPGRRGLEAVMRRLAGGLDDIHEVGLRAPEEDYLVLLPAGGCFLMLLAFPYAADLQALGKFDRQMPMARRRRLAAFYRGCLQRHLYVSGSGRTLLSKNAAFGSWIGALHEQCPSARFLICVREPVAAFHSQIRAVTPARGLFATAVDQALFQRIFLDSLAGTLEHLAATLREWPPGRAALIDLEDVRTAPGEVIAEALARVDMSADGVLSSVLEGLPRRSSGESGHVAGPVALADDALVERLHPPYRRLLSLPLRAGVAP